MRLLKKEREALAALLEQGADTPEELAEIVAAELDRLRGERNYHYAVAHTDGPSQVLGPFATVGQANKAVRKYPATKTFFLTHGNTAEGLDRIIREVDEPPVRKGDAEDIQADVLAFSRGWKGNKRDRSAFL